MKNIVYILILTLITNVAFSQEKPFDKKLFKEQKEDFKIAMGHIESGDDLIAGYPADYRLAVVEYLKANDFNNNSADLNYKIGICYYNFDQYKMHSYFQKAYKLKPSVSYDINFYLGICHQLNGEWQKAINQYNLFGKSAPIEYADLKVVAARKVEECNHGRELSQTKARVWVDNLGGTINSEFPDYGPVISADESIMVYTSRRADREIKSPDGDFFEDIYSSEREKGAWVIAQNVGEPVNVKKQHDATIGLSPDGHTLFVYNDRRGNGDILISNDEDGFWSKPIALGKNVNTKDYHEPGASLSFDGKTLYFISNKPGGLGMHDIYSSNWDEDKEEWGEAVNLGSVLNTKYEERCVFIHPDGETMYFASTGHNTMGGYDLFYSKLVNGAWQKPVNFGPPLNTPGHDVQLVVAGNGRYGYYSSYKPDGFGEKDIYLITFLGPEKLPLISNEDNLIASIAEPIKEKFVEPQIISEGSNMAILTGIIRDEKTKKPLKGQVVLIDNEENKVMAEFNSDGISGKFLVSLPGGKNYGIAVKKDGYLFHSENFVIPNESGFRQYEKDVNLKKVEIGQKIILRNVFFDLNKHSLRTESVNELNRLVKLMNENPTMKIELSGHTDTRGSADHNRVLSENRAKSVVDFLVSHGISMDRLEFKGYGETQPINSDSKINAQKSRTKREELHQENRRTEFKILSL